MIRRLKPTRIELKKSDLEEFEQRVRDNSLNGSLANSLDVQNSLPNDAAKRQAEIHKRIGYQPETVSNDGATNIHF